METPDDVKLIVAELAEISLVLQAMLNAEQREWLSDKLAARDEDARSVSGFQSNGDQR